MPTGKTPAVSFHGQSGDIAGGGGKFLKRPTKGFGWIWLSAGYRVRFHGTWRHVNLV